MSGTQGFHDTSGAQAGAEHYLPRPGFEQNVATAFDALFTRLDHVQETIIQLPTNVSDTVAGFVQSIVDQPPSHSVPRSNSQALQIDTRQLQDLQSQIQDLTAKNESLIEKSTSLEGANEQLKADNNKKTSETRRLHDIIIQSGQKDGDISDQAIVQKFDSLYHQIMTIVTRHYTGPAVKVHKTSTMSRMTGDDRTFFLRSKVASILHRRLFDAEAQLFGFDDNHERVHKEIERMLREQHAPESEVAEWRVAAVRVAMRLEGDIRKQRVEDLADHVRDVVAASCSIPVAKAPDADLDNLCAAAYDLALLLRRCKASYDWQQKRDTLGSLKVDDVEMTGPFDAYNNSAPLYPVRIMFGPLYKGQGSDRVLLRTGDVLQGNRANPDHR